MFIALNLLKGFLNPKIIMVVVISVIVFGAGYKFGSSTTKNSMQLIIDKQRLSYQHNLDFITKKFNLKVKEVEDLKKIINDNNKKANDERLRLESINAKVSARLSFVIARNKTTIKYIKLENKSIIEKLNAHENKILNTELSPVYINWLFSGTNKTQSHH